MTAEQENRAKELISIESKTKEQFDELYELIHTKALEILQKSMNIQHPDSRKKDYPDTWFDHLEHIEEEMIIAAMMDYSIWVTEQIFKVN